MHARRDEEKDEILLTKGKKHVTFAITYSDLTWKLDRNVRRWTCSLICIRIIYLHALTERRVGGRLNFKWIRKYMYI